MIVLLLLSINKIYAVSKIVDTSEALTSYTFSQWINTYCPAIINNTQLVNFTYLTKTFLAGPDRRVNNLQEQLTSARVEDEDCSVDWLRCQVALERLQTYHCSAADDMRRKDM